MSVKQKYLKDENGEVFSPITSESSIYTSSGNDMSIQAITNIAVIIHIEIGIPAISPSIGKNGIITIIGTSINLNIVNLFAKFIFLSLLLSF